MDDEYDPPCLPGVRRKLYVEPPGAGEEDEDEDWDFVVIVHLVSKMEAV